MAAWPGSLPTAPLVGEFRYEPVPQSISTAMDTGPPQRRRRFSTAFGRYHMAFILTGAQRATFQTFYVTTASGGSATITGFTDPTDGSTATFQIAAGGDPVWTPLSSSATASLRKWHLAMVWDRVA